MLLDTGHVEDAIDGSCCFASSSAVLRVRRARNRANVAALAVCDVSEQYLLGILPCRSHASLSESVVPRPTIAHRVRRRP